ncbi:MAG: HAD family hydrolase [Micromonosporaceae bacterium]
MPAAIVPRLHDAVVFDLDGVVVHTVREPGDCDIFEDATSLARRLLRRGIKTAVVSATCDCAAVVKAAGIADLFGVQVSSQPTADSAEPSGPPGPELFLEAARQLGVPPERTVVIEDAPAELSGDQRGGLALVIGVDRMDHAAELRERGADVIIGDLTDVQITEVVDRGGNVPPVSGWILRYEGLVPLKEGLREALCTVGNGYFATRGAAPESYADGTHYPGTYVAGCFNLLETEIAGRVTKNESLVNVPNWLPLTFAAEDGQWLDLGVMEVLEHSQELDLRRGTLTRQFRVRDGAGRTTRVTQRRFAHMGLAHVAAIDMTILPEDWSGRLRIRSELDGTVQNTGVVRYRQLDSRHLIPAETRPLDAGRVLMVVETSQSHIRIAEASRTRVMRNGVPCTCDATVLQEPGRIGHELTIGVAEHDTVNVVKTVAIATSRDHAVSDAATAATGWLDAAGSFDELLSQHVMAWAHLWQRFRIVLDETDDGMLPVARLHLFHLLQTVSPSTEDLDAGVPARGLHGEAYRGHVFWDELFVLPILNLRLPELSRALLRYRHRRLPAARRAALQAGCAGAMFPWQSGSDGSEQSALWHLNPRSGRWLPDTTYRQRHVGIAVAYNVWQYYQATGDSDFLARQGAEIILEIARFFASLATYDRGRDRYVIRGVVGPDEFHTGYPDSEAQGIDNNAYTNLMTVWLLLRAIEVLDLLPGQRGSELTDTLGIGAAERERWEHITRRMLVPFHSGGIISQFEGYENLQELDWEDYRARFGDVSRLDRILEAEDDTPNRYKASKQADVLMLFYLLSADELAGLLRRLGYEWDARSIQDTTDYYLARTSHGSTLSAVVHAGVLARQKRERALSYLVEALRSDIADTQGGTTAEGIHLAAMTGTIDLLQRCFAGLETHGDVLWLNPFWPEHLGAIELCIAYRDHLLTVNIEARVVRVKSSPGRQPPIHIGWLGAVHVLRPGHSLEFPTPAAATTGDGQQAQ